MNAKSVKHLSNRRDLTFQEDGNGPGVVVGHVVEEPAARRSRAVELKFYLGFTEYLRDPHITKRT